MFGQNMRFLNVLLVLASIESVSGQLTVSVGSTTDGGTALFYKNDSTVSLSAFVAGWTNIRVGSSHRSAALVFRDAYIEDSVVSLSPGQQRSLPVGGPGLTVSQAQILAAVFEDGSTFGDPAWVRILQMRRGYYLTALNAGIADLGTGASENLTPQLLAQLLTSSQSSQISAINTLGGGVTDMQQLFSEPTQALKDANLRVVAANNWRGCIRIVYTPLLKNISKPPKLPDGSQLPLSTLISDFTSHMSDKRVKLLIAKPIPLL
jgi:hypothetical protein